MNWKAKEMLTVCITALAVAQVGLGLLAMIMKDCLGLDLISKYFWVFVAPIVIAIGTSGIVFIVYLIILAHELLGKKS